MIARLIRWSVANRFLILLGSLLLAAWGSWATLRTPLDALPDLSDVQVIVETRWPGQAPQIVQDQVTYPVTTTMMSVPGARAVRGYSGFGSSFVYVLFADGTDPYWARSRVLEYLSQVQARLPAGASVALGPDATGVGWIYQYALIDRSGSRDLGQLRALQDWFLRYELKSVPDVAEVATIGGMVREYQVVLNPQRLVAYEVTPEQVIGAIRRGNGEAGGAVIELAEADYMVRADGYLKTLDDFRAVPVKLGANGVPVTLGDLARVQIGPALRFGVGELDGEGEAVGGIVIMRPGSNALATIAAVKARVEALKPGLPDGVEIVPTYDRSQLIDRAVANLGRTLLEEFIVVALVCLVFLLHLRSALVAIVALPLGVVTAFIIMREQGISADVMSLGGIAIAIGAMVDAAVVMIENAHKKLELWRHAHPGATIAAEERWQAVTAAAVEVGPALFFSLLIITLSFLPIFSLQGQEGRLFGPLAWTKTWAMAVAAGLSVTLVPALMGWMIRGRLPDERANPLNRVLAAAYRPLLERVLRFPKTSFAVALALLALTAWPALRLGGEFLPHFDEGDLIYMPTALPGLSADKAAELLQQTDRLILSVPEVARVHGKAGRADTATDPAPLEMFETTIQLKPRSEWRPGLDMEGLIAELDRRVQIPGLTNTWVPPIRNRLDMLATGIKSPIGIKVFGPELAEIDRLSQAIEAAVREVPGVRSALAERLGGGRYVDVHVDRARAARYGLNVDDVHDLLRSAIGGAEIDQVIDGAARYPISVRYPRELRDTPQRLRELPLLTAAGAQLPLGAVADISISDGPPMLQSENGRLSGRVYVDVAGRDLVSTVGDLQATVAREVQLPPGYSIGWSGQFEYWQHAVARLQLVVPATLLLIFLLLYLNFRRVDEALLVLASLPFALIGGVWLMYLLDFRMSIASAVGFIALAGLAAEFGVIMLLYLRQAWERRLAAGEPANLDTLLAAVREGAVQRVRPKAMTVAVVVAGLLPILLGHGTGSELMQRIAAPMLGGMLSAPLLSMLLLPLSWELLRRRSLTSGAVSTPQAKAGQPAGAD